MAVLVYGDPWKDLDLATWRERAAAPLAGDAWIERHAALAERLIEGGQILQALQDEAFHRAGQRDHIDLRWRAMQRWLTAVARSLIVSFDRRAGEHCPAPPALPAGAPDRIRAREPEGYAFYALYPEAYARAARRLPPDRDALVIGLRSIGASLAPVVAAVLGAPDFVTLRPKGGAFGRMIEAPDLGAALASKPARCVAIVDEGPGLSGSSFTGVATFVRAHQPQSRIAFVPSHGHGPGAEASAETRAMFSTVPQRVASFDDALPTLLPDWVADLTGAALAPLQDLSGGEWRRHCYDGEDEWPCVDPMQERRKFLLRGARGDFLLKFAGLGEIGARKARMAIALGEAGLAPEALGIRHGFLVERWRADARPLHPRRDRAALLPALARYLAFRLTRFACPDACGADADDLRTMVVRNVSLALGAKAGERAGRFMAPLVDGAPRLRRIATDNRMHAHEWRVSPDGRLLKTDAVDHHAAHDLIGAQDVSFDIAAACVEFDLTRDELRDLRQRIENDSAQSVSRDFVEPMKIAWLAFELGRASFAESACGSGPDGNRIIARRTRLTERLQRELDLSPS